jgi:hypothetical protein
LGLGFPFFLVLCFLSPSLFTAVYLRAFACHSFNMPSPSLFLGSSATLVSALLFSRASAGIVPSFTTPSATYYALDQDYSGTNFLDGFTFFHVRLHLDLRKAQPRLTIT